MIKILLQFLSLLAIGWGLYLLIANRPSHRVVAPTEVEQTPAVDNTLRVKGLQGSFK